MIARDIMGRDLIYVSPQTSVKEIFQIMISLDTPFLPVLDNNNKVIGYILEKNLLSRMKLHKAQTGEEKIEIHLDHNEFIKEQKKLYGGTAKDIMETDIISIDENTNVVDVVELMLSKNIYRLPVVRKDRVVGCVTSHDVLEALYHLEEGKKLESVPVSNEELRYKVYSAIKRNLDVHVSKLDVNVKEGHVNLLGSVSRLEDYKAVEDIVRSMPGVKSVSNSLIIEQMLR
ncbi:MAG: CBS domain-containing protein [Armatimonadota bacterium]